MNSIFDIKRFGHLLKRNLVRDRLQYLYIACALVGIYIILAVIYSVSDNDFVILLLPASLILLVISPCVFESNADDSNLFDLEVPASVTEKFIALWLKYVIFIPLIVNVLCVLISMLHIKMVNISAEPLFVFNDGWFSRMSSWVALQSVFMLGYLYFKKVPLIKSIAVIVAISILFSFVGRIIVSFMAPEVIGTNSIAYVFGQGVPIFTSGGKLIQVGTLGIGYEIAKWIMSFILPFGIWIVCFLRMREREI